MRRWPSAIPNGVGSRPISPIGTDLWPVCLEYGKTDGRGTAKRFRRPARAYRCRLVPHPVVRSEHVITLGVVDDADEREMVVGRGRRRLAHVGRHDGGDDDALCHTDADGSSPYRGKKERRFR